MSGDAYVAIPADESFVRSLRTEVGLLDAGKITTVKTSFLMKACFDTHLPSMLFTLHISCRYKGWHAILHTPSIPCIMGKVLNESILEWHLMVGVSQDFEDFES
jgi:hypothetical protein